jgi:hypothetical protein
MITKKLGISAIALTSLVCLGACNERPLSYGDANSIIAVMAADRWDLVQTDVFEALEPTISTVRSEKTFTVTYQEPFLEFWDRLRRFRQMLVVGTRGDAWVQEVMDRARDPITENGLHQAYDVWSTGQSVTLVLLDEGWGPSDLEPYLPQVNELLDGQFRAYARSRMYFSGIDSALADTLSMRAGFTMYLPDVYRWQARDSVYIFRNDNPDPSELIRQITVTWLTPAPGEMAREAVLEWRNRIALEHYTEPQALVLEGSEERSFDFQGGHAAYELQAQWRNPPERNWPAGGPLTIRTVTCDGQDRTYLLDAWLYAPGKEKYEYMIQLETLLDSFRCTS